MMKIGTSGFRGIIADEYTKDNVCKIIECTCKIIEKQKFKREVVIGYDNRFMSEIFAKWASQVFAWHNIKVKITKTSVSSPLMSFVGKYTGNDITIMITASHNPYMYNGVKIFSKNGQDLELYIENLYSKYLPKIKKYNLIDFDEGVKNNLIEFVNYTKEYVANIVSLMKYKKDIKLKTLFNVMNGSSLCSIEELKRKLKLDVEIVNSKRDALFNLTGPIPNEDNLEEYKKYALKNKVDFAFATDGDGDRVAVFDEKGNYYAGNELACLLYYFAIKEKGLKGGFVKNYSFSLLADKICEKFNVQLYETQIGFKYISQKMIDTNALIGAENSGVEIRGDVYTKDGLVVYALLLEIVNYYKKPLSEIIRDMKKEVSYNMYYKEVSFKVKDKKKIINVLQKMTPNFNKEIVKTGTLDGFKYYFKDGSWLLIRFSGTENLLRLVCEQFSTLEVDKMIELSKRFVDSL